ncbi:MAG: hypothetical protein GX751_08510 [Desulfuromonadaceae bacterium]|nr:hypothetical protein [Desulfuromonadaceae bacterium]
MKRILITLITLAFFSPTFVFGQEFYDRLDDTEKQAMMETLQYALDQNKEGEESSWAIPETGSSGAVTPLASFVNENGNSCRDFISTILINGDEERNNGTACRQADGTWIVVSSSTTSTYAARVASRQIHVYRDPYLYWYPWVYYAPYHYPHRIFFSFVFSSRHGHFHRSRFHDGQRYVGSPHFHPRVRSARGMNRSSRFRSSPVVRPASHHRSPFYPPGRSLSPRDAGVMKARPPRRQEAPAKAVRPASAVNNAHPDRGNLRRPAGAKVSGHRLPARGPAQFRGKARVPAAASPVLRTPKPLARPAIRDARKVSPSPTIRAKPSLRQRSHPRNRSRGDSSVRAKGVRGGLDSSRGWQPGSRRR